MQTDCQHVISRLVSKEGDAPEWVQETAWKHFDGTRRRCELCGRIEPYPWAQFLVD